MTNLQVEQLEARDLLFFPVFPPILGGDIGPPTNPSAESAFIPESAVTRRVHRETLKVDGKITHGLVPGSVLSLLGWANSLRAAVGVPPLIVDWRLQPEAANFALGMASTDHYLDSDTLHEWFGQSFLDRFEIANFQGSFLGENVAYNYGYQDGVQELAAQWQNSRAHYDNVVNPGFSFVGIGVAVSSTGKTYGEMMFGSFT
jgi:uncharacterized protein YkwD